MAKFVAIVAVVVLMVLMIDAKRVRVRPPSSCCSRGVPTGQISVDIIARAMKRSNKNSEECADFGEECGYWTGCCEGKGLECKSDSDSWFSKGTCWMKF